MRFLRNTVIVGGAATALALGVTTQAHAELSGAITSNDSCGWTQFEDLGDHFYIYDVCKDGRGVRVAWDIEGDGLGWYWRDYTGGYTGYSGPYDLNLDLPEKKWMHVKVGLVDNGSLVSNTWGYTEEVYTS
ncbi:MAG: hypothetical protein HOV68_00485 [Streptomycetaceae bacterium]|nr:hypothetical protein [Streptomycetaceae bacterium]